jgi:hypothetical protein
VSVISTGWDKHDGILANLLGLAACIEGDSTVALLSEGYTLVVVLWCMGRGG